MLGAGYADRGGVMRKCGNCRECCTVLGHSMSPWRTKCEHECLKGCAIYKNRPSECVEFACAWLMGHLPRKDRRDLSGIIMTSEDTAFGETLVLHETRANAHRRGRGAVLVELVARESGTQPAILKMHDGTSRMLNRATLTAAMGVLQKAGKE